MANWFRGIMTLHGRIKDIHTFLSEQLIRHDDHYDPTKEGVHDLSKGNGHIHFKLDDERNFIKDARAMVINMEEILVTAEDGDAPIKLDLYFQQANGVFPDDFLKMGRRYRMDIEAHAGDYLLNTRVRIIIWNDEVAVAETKCYEEDEDGAESPYMSIESMYYPPNENSRAMGIPKDELMGLVRAQADYPDAEAMLSSILKSSAAKYEQETANDNLTYILAPAVILQDAESQKILVTYRKEEGIQITDLTHCGALYEGENMTEAAIRMAMSLVQLQEKDIQSVRLCGFILDENPKFMHYHIGVICLIRTKGHDFRQHWRRKWLSHWAKPDVIDGIIERGEFDQWDLLTYEKLGQMSVLNSTTLAAATTFPMFLMTKYEAMEVAQ